MAQDTSLAWIAVVGVIASAVIGGFALIVVALINKTKPKSPPPEETGVVFGQPVTFDPTKALLADKDERLDEYAAEIKALRIELARVYQQRNAYQRILDQHGLHPETITTVVNLPGTTVTEETE